MGVCITVLSKFQSFGCVICILLAWGNRTLFGVLAMEERDSEQLSALTSTAAAS
jgi:hypothetical protein